MPVESELLREQFALEEKVDHLTARKQEWRIEMGRYLRRLKSIITKRFGHGHWESYLEERFDNSGIAARTARKYMKLAKMVDAEAKTARRADLQPGVDSQAEEVMEATAKAKKKLAEAKQPDFRFPVPLRPEEQEATKKLLASPHCGSAQREVAAAIRRLNIQYGFMQPYRFPRVAS